MEYKKGAGLSDKIFQTLQDIVASRLDIDFYLDRGSYPSSYTLRQRTYKSVKKRRAHGV